MIERNDVLHSLVRRSPFQTAGFFVRSGIIRNLLLERDGHVIVPLRGAMPIFESACGNDGYEDRIPSIIHELPIGTFHYLRNDGEPKQKSPNDAQKRVALQSVVDTIYASHGSSSLNRLTLLDEMQKGGTITQAARITRQALNEYRPDDTMRLIVAQDNRRAVMRQTRAPGYADLATNNVHGVESSVIALPLVATDRENLLDRLELTGNGHDQNDFLSRMSVEENHDARKMFRILGSISRTADLLHEGHGLDDLLSEIQDMEEIECDRTELWFSKFRAALIDKN